MLARERQTLIRERLERDGSVVAADLAGEFGVSEDTIRRDLRDMAADGICDKVYGGALVRTPQRPLTARLGERTGAKQALGAATAALLPRGSVVFIDAGSTNLAVARAIEAGTTMTVITNAPAIGAALADRQDIELIVIGGRVDPDLGAVVDAGAAAEVAGFNIDVFVFGACGFDPATGLTVQTYEERTFKRAVANRSAQVFAPLTAEKFTVRAPYNVIAVSERLTLVVDDEAPKAALAAIRRSDAKLIVAGEQA